MEAETVADKNSFIELTTDLVAAYLSNNHVQLSDLPGLIASTHAALAGLAAGATATGEAGTAKATPAAVKKSISHDTLISFEDGKPYKTLRRHLTLRGLTPETYREKHGLPPDYPMTSAAYSAHRSELAKSLGLGQQRRTYAKAAPADETVAEASAEAPKAARKPKASESKAKAPKASKAKKTAEPATAE